MADEKHVVQIFESEHTEDIGNVRIEVDFGARQMATLAKPGQRRRDQPVAARRLSGCIFFQIQPAPQAPCATRKVAMLFRSHSA
jgi:hypothetical protein